MTSYRQVKGAVGDQLWSTLLHLFSTEGVDLWLTP